ncbi:cell division protein FtsA [Bacillus sp. REN16]|uniref:cell division protein FtsA n=1 Tax=Bacillus sp. REN16 TaxID=2887296 RepID=UPI001E4F8DC0|nr:pilus assembly protein PilM [Bacillus sp. REN16]MCC3357985.1 pilus assembly protein PilM [Bacillus sp. REN16]
MEKNPTIFALDIGTRSVVGLIVRQTGSSYKIIDIVIREHKERAMVDGQIHDVIAVSNVIREIKETLEEKHGKLTKAAVAAAGRALKTERSNETIQISSKPLIQKEDILHLELSAVQKAQYALAEKNQSEKSYDYYCVGYSVIHYYLDNQEIGNLIEQQGNEVSVEIISTFLPKVVVESLISALHRAGLEMQALTLEPIAAINVLIPQSMRRLNVALVDIGAGTSDIAITDEGTVVAYGMVPIAGDEITEAISDHLLLDFPLAEQAKRDLLANDTIQVVDILGFETEIGKQEVIDNICDSIDRLAESIRDEILSLNKNKSPKAVMLVGGGSLTPQLPKRLAALLDLPENRVAIRGIDAINQVEMTEDIQSGPELVTPIGIAIASSQSPVHYVNVTVNQKSVRLFEMKRLTVGDSLLAAGIKMYKLYGKPGMAMIVKVNNQSITIPGGQGESPILLRNGEPCSFETEITNGDEIIVSKGRDGAKATVRVKELIDDIPQKKIYVNGEEMVITAIIKQNHQLADLENFVHDHDEITFYFPERIDEIIQTSTFPLRDEIINEFTLSLNEQTFQLEQFSAKLLKNGAKVSKHTPIQDQDSFEIVLGTAPTLRLFADSQKLKLDYSIQVFFQEKMISLNKPLYEFYRNGEILHEDDHLKHGDKLQLKRNEVEPFIFQDLFRFVDIQLPTASAGRFMLLKNGEECTFFDVLSPGDHLDIIWPKR